LDLKSEIQQYTDVMGRFASRYNGDIQANTNMHEKFQSSKNDTN